MITLKCTLEPGLSALASDPGGVFWAGRVQAWRDTFQGTAYVMLDSPRVTTLPSRAIVYVGAPDNVMAAQLDMLRRNWSTRTLWVSVASVAIVGAIPSATTDTAALSQNSAADLFGLGGAIKQVGTVALVVAGVAALVYFASKSKGTKTWR